MKMKLKNHWTTGETALQMFNEAFLRDTNKTQQTQDNSQQQVPSHTRPNERRNYDGGQLERSQRSITINVSGGVGWQEASTYNRSLSNTWKIFKKETARRQQLTTAKHKSKHKYASRSVQEDLGGRTSDNGLERRTLYQDTKETRSEQM
ncbi:unnamed protein product [Schistosoma curassoni]|uniref:Uncharacterized protein n=1 Tax=Schistosoma curassoni TaxID=6186 RepID=A0A183JKD5_9TREM|nr:unnamed protein product [Schistosoma curassoni]